MLKNLALVYASQCVPLCKMLPPPFQAWIGHWGLLSLLFCARNLTLWVQETAGDPQLSRPILPLLHLHERSNCRLAVLFQLGGVKLSQHSHRGNWRWQAIFQGCG